MTISWSSVHSLLLLIVAACGLNQPVKAQQYHALHGNRYGSGLTVYNNPASIVHQSHGWDLTLFGMQQTISNNIVGIYDYNLLKSPDKGFTQANEGFYARKLHLQGDLRLFNLRVQIGRNRAIAAGANIRHHTHLRTSPYYFIDTLLDANDFFSKNQLASVPIHAYGIQSSWGELFFSYAQTLWDNELSRFSLGGTVKLQRGISGGYVQLENGYFNQTMQGMQPQFEVTQGRGRYAYSSNFDRISDQKTDRQNLQDFLGNTLNGGSLNVGAEWILRYDGLVQDGESEAAAYRWKVGVSLLDLGRNQYRHSVNSRRFNGFQNPIPDTVLQQKFENIGDITSFNDSLATIATGFSGINGLFQINMPTRLVVNVDRHLIRNFYVNANLTMNLRSSFPQKAMNFSSTSQFAVRSLDLITLTPRWETQRWGAYLPIQYNTEGDLWMGMAAKAGPVVFGLHHVGWLFGNKAMPNGGFYLALILRGWKSKQNEGRDIACPPL